MPNTREKLFALLKDYRCEFQSCGECPHSNVKGACGNYVFNEMADHLIANGVTIPVRCKDCKYWDEHNKMLYSYDSKPENKDNLVDFAECSRWSCWSTCRSTRFNDFCSLGERRNDV